MENKLFKAKIPFSSEHGIFNPGHSEPYFAPVSYVQAWIDAGYAVEVDGEAPKTESVIEPHNEPDIEENEQDNVFVPEEEEKAEINEIQEPQNDVSSMSYPQLKKAAKAAGVKNYHMMKQADLIKALKG